MKGTNGVNPVYRQLAFITLACMDKKGNIDLDKKDFLLIIPYLKLNLMLVFEKDALIGLSKLATDMDDTEWQNDLSKRLKEWEGAAQ